MENKHWERQLSGHLTIVKCKCPDCGMIYSTPMPVEFAEDKDVWKENDLFMVLCHDCRQKR